MVSTDKGYIKIYRDIREHWIWNDRPFSRGQAWIDLIMMVNHEDRTIVFDSHPLRIGRSQIMTSLQKLSDRWGWSRVKVKRFLDDLETEQMLTKKRNSRGTLITLVNYGIYQGTRNTKRNTDETLTERSRDADEHKQYTIECTNECTKEKYVPLRGLAEYEPLTPEEIEAGGWE